MDIQIVQGLSLVLQLAAAGLALWLIRITGRRVAWAFIALGIGSMAVVRSIGLYRTVVEDVVHHPGLAVEVLALVVSLALVAGLALLIPLFRFFQRSEDALREREMRFKGLAEAAFEGIVVHEQGRVVDANSCFAQMFGYEVAELLGMSAIDFISPDSREMVVRRSKGDEELVFDYNGIRKDGSIFPVEVRGKTTAYKGREVRVTAIRDVTERKRTQERLRFLSSAIEQATEGIATVDLEGRLLFVNDAFAAMHGFTSDELIGKNLTVFHSPEQLPSVEAATKQIRETGVFHGEIWHKHRDGTVFPASMHNSLLCDAKGRPIGIIAILRDISEQKQAAEELEQHRHHLEELVDQRTTKLSEANESLQREIAERARVEAALRESEERFRSLSASAPIGIFLTDVREKCVYTNEYLQAACGLTSQECDDADWRQLIHPDDRARVEAEVARTRRERCHFSGEFRIQTPQGSVRWVDVNTASIMSSEGERIGRVGTVEDVTDRKLAEKKLTQLAQEQRTLLENTGDFLYRHDPKGVFTFLSPAVEQITGYTLDEWRTHYTTYMTDNPINEPVITQTEETLRTGREAPPYLVEIVHKDGHPIVLEVNERPYYEDGKIAGIIGVARDVTDRVRAEEALRESEQRLQGILDNTTALIYLKDLEGRYLLVNRRFEELFHVEKERFVGRCAHDFLPKQMADLCWANDEQVIESNKPTEFEEVTLHDDGPHTYISLKFPLPDAAGVPCAVCGISTDITERKQVAVELHQAKEAAEKANRTRSAFLANLSHEIRTPITALLGAAELMARDDSVPQGQGRADIILRNGRHLLYLIDDLLDLSRAEAGKLEIDRKHCSLLDIMADVEAVTRPLHRRRSVEFRILYQTPVPLRIHTDPTRLKQGLINLASNALKFTEKGTVCIRVSVNREQDEPRLCVAVEDTGPGVSDSDAERIFETFTQGGPGASGIAEGVGLGLPLARWIAEQLGGTVTLTSREEGGSVFALSAATGSLDAARWVSPPETLIPPSGERAVDEDRDRLRLSGRILLAEDFADTRNLILEALTARGANVTAVGNGREAVEAALASSYDLILMDVRMPEMDGSVAIAELRRRGCVTPAIALTAYADVNDQAGILDAGFDDLWTKPVTLGRLIEGVAAYLSTYERSPDPQSASGEDAQSSKALDSRLKAVRVEFIQGLPARLEAVKAALEVGDLSQAGDSLHQLVGAGGIYGFMPLSLEAARLQKLARDGTLGSQPDELDHFEELIRQAGETLSAARGSGQSKPGGG